MAATWSKYSLTNNKLIIPADHARCSRFTGRPLDGWTAPLRRTCRLCRGPRPPDALCEARKSAGGSVSETPTCPHCSRLTPCAHGTRSKRDCVPPKPTQTDARRRTQPCVRPWAAAHHLPQQLQQRRVRMDCCPAGLNHGRAQPCRWHGPAVAGKSEAARARLRAAVRVSSTCTNLRPRSSSRTRFAREARHRMPAQRCTASRRSAVQAARASSELPYIQRSLAPWAATSTRHQDRGSQLAREYGACRRTHAGGPPLCPLLGAQRSSFGETEDLVRGSTRPSLRRKHPPGCSTLGQGGAGCTRRVLHSTEASSRSTGLVWAVQRNPHPQARAAL